MAQSFFHEQLQFTRFFKKKLNERLAQIGLFHSQWLLVYYLRQQETATLVEISSYLNVEKPTISRTVRRLEDQQIIKKIQTSDKRERRIKLTEKGISVYEEAIQVVTTFEQDLMEGMTEQDLKTTLRTIQILMEKLK